MDNTVSGRIELIMSHFKLNKNSFSKAIGLKSNTTIGQIVNDKRSPGYIILNRIMETFSDINANWLLTGKGEMLIDKTSSTANTGDNSDKIVDRIFKYLDIKGIPYTRFEKKAGLSNGYLTTQKKREAGLGEDIIKKIIDNCRDINPAWLLTGKGEMFLYDEEQSNNASKIINKLKKLLGVETDDQLSERIKIPTYTLGFWRSDNNVDRDTISNVCKRFNIDFNDVFSHDNVTQKQGNVANVDKDVIIKNLEERLKEQKESFKTIIDSKDAIIKMLEEKLKEPKNQTHQ